MAISDIPHLLALANRLGATPTNAWSPREQKIQRNARLNSAAISAADVRATRNAIRNGHDPLGEIYQAIQSSKSKRDTGAVYTPAALVNTMCAWTTEQGQFARIVEPGCGSARFLLRMASLHPKAHLVGVDNDPIATILARANLAAIGASKRTTIKNTDYLTALLPDVSGRTLFIGNPPYVRHHDLDQKTKRWFSTVCNRLDIKCSKLAGLHILFYFATLTHASEGDCGTFITSAEWLEVNYGAALRKLFLNELGGRRVVIFDRAANPFPGTLTTAAITTFEPGARPAVISIKDVNTVEEFKNMRGGRTLPVKQLSLAIKWPPKQINTRHTPADFIELGELFKVHRGQVTGSNRVWIVGPDTPPLPSHALKKCVTRAREIMHIGLSLSDAKELREVIELPANLDALASRDRELVERFLYFAKRLKAHESYTARHRDPWWSVKLRDPAPVLATYMARGEPNFVLNQANACHINIVHGLYPRESISRSQLLAIVKYMNSAQSRHIGRTYAGGLTKFEPSEMARILIPSPAIAKDIAVA